METTEEETTEVQQSVLIRNQIDDIVRELVQIRKDAGFTQQFMAEWLSVDRRKIIAIESHDCYDLLLIADYADKLSVEITIISNSN